jgi:putative transposase
MKRSKFSEGEIIRVLREGKSVYEVCRKYGIAASTYYKWNSKYGGLDEESMRRLKELKEYNGCILRSTYRIAPYEREAVYTRKNSTYK